VDSRSEVSGLDHHYLQTILISRSMGNQALEHRQAPRSAADDRDPIHDRAQHAWIGGTGASGGGFSIRLLTDSPASGANAET
jgi:hypothetical protein